MILDLICPEFSEDYQVFWQLDKFDSLKNGVLRLRFKLEWFVDLFKAGNAFFLDFD